jgi:hypothetical protein
MNPIIEEAALAFAWELGRSDYPAVDQCPYNPAKSANLNAAYWHGWRRNSEVNGRKSAA